MKNKDKNKKIEENIEDTKEKPKKKFRKVKLIMILILLFAICCGGLFVYLKYIQRNELGIKEKTYTHIDGEGNKSTIKIKGNTIIFVDFDFKETYETLALIALSKELGTSLNDYDSLKQKELIKDKRDSLTKAQIFKRNTPYEYTYFEETGLLTITSGGYTLSFGYKEKQVNKFFKFLKTPSITLYQNLYE